MEILLWIISVVGLALAIISLRMITRIMGFMHGNEEDVRHLTVRVDSLMECVRDFNKKLKDRGIY